MEDESKIRNAAKWGAGVAGLGGVATAITVPKIGIWIAMAILVLFVLLIGGYYLWHRARTKRQSRKFEVDMERETAATPRSISDPNKRATLDKLRSKFQDGLQKYKERGKDIYKLPWYAIIGESGSGKTEAIRHSQIGFPQGLQDEYQGSGGTVNMDWWFTNHGIILDTAGSMIFNEASAGEAPEWKEFLRLLKKSRPHCPINGLILVLSIDSLIKDSADTIARKAGKLAQQLDLIQRSLDVRFPVYLLVTKCDLLTGFREFFESIDVVDPSLQSQMFGWSNPEPLDAHFRPDLVEQHLQNVATQLRRRRLALLRESSSGAATGDEATRRLDEMDSLFALPESVMRLAPRLRRYLETVFVAGEWSAKPVFLRGIYFTSSMREGRALDEAMAFATGLSWDQLPEDRGGDKDRAFFLRDLFLEKVFRERGLVTRATNTLKLLRQRQLLIFGSGGFALLLLLAFSIFAYLDLQRSVGAEAKYWEAGAKNWVDREWSPPIVRSASNDVFQYNYAGNDQLNAAVGLPLVEYHKHLREIAGRPIAVGWIFTPVSWLASAKDLDRPKAQRIVFEGGVLRPLFERTRAKMNRPDAKSTLAGQELVRHKDALFALAQLEADGLMADAARGALGRTNAAENYLHALLSYLTETNITPDANLVEAFNWTYSTNRLRDVRQWPPTNLLAGNSLSSNTAIKTGLDLFLASSRTAQTNIQTELKLLNESADSLKEHQQMETNWLANASGDACDKITNALAASKQSVSIGLVKLARSTNLVDGPLTNLASLYRSLAEKAKQASKLSISEITSGLSEASRGGGLFSEIPAKLNEFKDQAGKLVLVNYESRSNEIAAIDRDLLPLRGSSHVYESRWELYRQACNLASDPLKWEDGLIGEEWKRYRSLRSKADTFRTNLAAYAGPLASAILDACDRLAREAEQRLKEKFVAEYVVKVEIKLGSFTNQSPWTIQEVTNANEWFVRIGRDLEAENGLDPKEMGKLKPLKNLLTESKKGVLDGYVRNARASLKKKLGFPVASKSKNILDANGLVILKKHLETLSTELTNRVWESFAGSENALAGLRREMSPYGEVARAFVSKENELSGWTILLVPPDPNNEPDRDALATFRVVQADVAGTKSRWEDTTRGKPITLGEGKMDQGISISFRRLEDDAASEVPTGYPSWALPRLVLANDHAQRINGSKWRVRVKLDVPNQEKAGYATFELVFDQPLPSLEDWPKE